MKTLFLDAGHGGIDPVTKKYTTPPTTGKFWDHKTGVFHSGSIFYEGVSNRVFANKLKNKLVLEGVNVVMVNHEYLDNSLASRSDIANAYHNTVAKGFYLSMHSNAVGVQDKAKGISAWTSKGNGDSDVYASIILNNLSRDIDFKKFGTCMRTDMSDKDGDYEADFHVLVKTKMPAVLIENLFFDNRHEAQLLMNEEYQDAFTNSLITSLKEILK